MTPARIMETTTGCLCFSSSTDFFVLFSCHPSLFALFPIWLGLATTVVWLITSMWETHQIELALPYIAARFFFPHYGTGFILEATCLLRYQVENGIVILLVILVDSSSELKILVGTLCMLWQLIWAWLKFNHDNSPFEYDIDYDFDSVTDVREQRGVCKLCTKCVVHLKSSITHSAPARQSLASTARGNRSHSP